MATLFDLLRNEPLPRPPTTVRALLAEQFLAQSEQREASIARFMVGLAIVCVPLDLALWPLIGTALALGILGTLAAVISYYLVVLSLIRRARFHPALSLGGIALEVSAPTVLLILDTATHGPAYALTAPPVVLWGALIMLSGLRAKPPLAFAAGALAALEYLATYAFIIVPAMPEPPLVSLAGPFIAIRALFLLASGALTAVVSMHFKRQAEAAVSGVRERDLLSKYVIHEQLGRGGMAEVYRATYCPEGGFEKAVAIKRIRADRSGDDTFARLFKREAAISASLHHPNIVQVYDVAYLEEGYFLSMELVEGIALDGIFRYLGRPLEIAAISFLGAELAAALEHVHGRRGSKGPLLLVHRDVNPPNVLVSDLGDVKLSDFGIARAAASETVTKAGHIRGKVRYMAPEQLVGEAYDGRADLWALGVTLHELLTGQFLFTSDGEVRRLRSGGEDLVRPPSLGRPEISRELDAIVEGLLQVDPNRRTDSGAEVRRRLQALAGVEAPYPHGQALLARAVLEARQRRQSAGTKEPADGPTAELPAETRSDRPKLSLA